MLVLNYSGFSSLNRRLRAQKQEKDVGSVAVINLKLQTGARRFSSVAF